MSVDQMISDAPGYVAQMTGIPTRQRYTTAMVFVDQATKYTQVYFQYSISAEETIRAKEKFEQHLESFGVPVKAYHADNGIFASNEWKRHCEIRGQMLTFAGVGPPSLRHLGSYSRSALRFQKQTHAFCFDLVLCFSLSSQNSTRSTQKQ